MASVDNLSELNEAKTNLFNPSSYSGWVLLEYVKPAVLHFTKTGNGTVDELSSHLLDDQVQYALLRLKGGRDVFISWVGPAVGVFEKGKKKSHASDAMRFLQPFHVELTVVNRAKFTEEIVKAKTEPNSGSHVID